MIKKNYFMFFLLLQLIVLAGAKAGVPQDTLYLILSKRQEKGIYGTGHNSVLQIPGKDEWYIVYHRFRRPNAIKMGWAAGYRREVCMDKLEFNEDGSIRPVTPTL